MIDNKKCLDISNLPKFICEQILQRNNDYFQLMGVFVSFFRNSEKNEVNIIFSHKVLDIETRDLIHNQEFVFKQLLHECQKIKNALSMGGL